MARADGLLIMFDGPDGVGKSTQLELTAAVLRAAGCDVYTTHMLGGSAIGEALRSVLFSTISRPAVTNVHISLAIYYALAEAVAEQRSQGKIVLIDRSPLSLVAYQVFGDGFDQAQGLVACQDALQAFQPDLVLIYEAPLEILQQRRQLQQQQKASDYFEQQELSYHQRTTAGYGFAAERFAATLVTAADDQATVQRRTIALIEPLLTQ